MLTALIAHFIRLDCRDRSGCSESSHPRALSVQNDRSQIEGPRESPAHILSLEAKGSGILNCKRYETFALRHTSLHDQLDFDSHTNL